MPDAIAVVRDLIRGRHPQQCELGGPIDRGPSISAIDGQMRRCLNPAAKPVLLAVIRPRDPTPIFHGRTHRHRDGPARCVGHRHRAGDSATMHRGHGLTEALGDRPRGTGVEASAPSDTRSPGVEIGASRTELPSRVSPCSARTAASPCSAVDRTRAARRLRTARSVICGPSPCCIRSAATNAARSPPMVPAGSPRWRAACGGAASP